MPQQSGVVMPTQGTDTPGVISDALKQYPILQNIGLQGVYSDKPLKYHGDIESWSPTEEGEPDNLRPAGLPKGTFGVQVYQGGKTKPIDVLADAVSHHLVNTDPQMKQYYQEFKDSLTPKQQDKLKADYQYAKENEGETRPFEQWVEASRLPAFFRGYTFNQWPKEFTSKLFTPDQIKLFDKV